jgi:hypothetical protein
VVISSEQQSTPRQHRCCPPSALSQPTVDRGTFQPGDMMYTYPENVSQTIALQQRLLRQAMIQQAQLLKQHGYQSNSSSNNGRNRRPHDDDNVVIKQCEWKVGSREHLEVSRKICKCTITECLKICI